MKQMRLLKLRFKGSCVVCELQLEPGSEAWWDSGSHKVRCMSCHNGGPVNESDARPEPAFEAGRSAQRMADRKREKERAEWKNAGLLKKAAIVWRDPPSKAKPWARGAEGERIVGRGLEKLQEAGLIATLHDIRMPHSSANIDHVAVAPSGIHIIDAKHYKGAQIEIVDRGGWLRSDVQLRVAKRNRNNLVDKLARQVLAVDSVLRDVSIPTVVTPVLCFVDALWGVFRKQYSLSGVQIVPPRKLEELLRRNGPLSSAEIQQIGRLLRVRLRPA